MNLLPADINKSQRRRKWRKKYLVLLNSLDSNAISAGLIGGNICITKLTMTQQFPNCIPLIKILLIPKIRSFTTWNRPTLPPRPWLPNQMRIPGRLILIALFSFIMRPTLFGWDRGMGWGRTLVRSSLPIMVVVISGGVGRLGIAIRTTYFDGWKTAPHIVKTTQHQKNPTFIILFSFSFSSCNLWSFLRYQKKIQKNHQTSRY